MARVLFYIRKAHSISMMTIFPISNHRPGLAAQQLHCVVGSVGSNVWGFMAKYRPATGIDRMQEVCG